MRATDEIDVSAQDARFDIVGANHVVGNEQDFLTGDPGIVLLDRGGQLRNPAGGRITRKNQVQNRHEMALAATEAAVQIRGLAGRPLD